MEVGSDPRGRLQRWRGACSSGGSMKRKSPCAAPMALHFKGPHAPCSEPGEQMNSSVKGAWNTGQRTQRYTDGFQDHAPKSV